jgi:hypothetical protein
VSARKRDRSDRGVTTSGGARHARRYDTRMSVAGAFGRSGARLINGAQRGGGAPGGGGAEGAETPERREVGAMRGPTDEGFPPRERHPQGSLPRLRETRWAGTHHRGERNGKGGRPGGCGAARPGAGTGRREGVEGPGGVGGGKSPNGFSPQRAMLAIHRMNLETVTSYRATDRQRRRAGCVTMQ